MINNKKGFTLIELIVVLAIIAVLVGVLIAVIKPQQIFGRLRDTQRMTDLNNLARAIDIYLADFASDPSQIKLTGTNSESCLGGTASVTIYYSVATSGTLSIPGPSGTFTRELGSTSTLVNGNGWLPVPLSDSPLLNISQLPLDPRNSWPNFYYTYACDKSDFSFELNANLETLTINETRDEGDNPDLYEVGSGRIKILPGATTSGFYK